MVQLKIVPCEMPTTLLDCPPGLFLFRIDSGEPSVGFKSEYGKGATTMEVYCVDSGEAFWGGTGNELVTFWSKRDERRTDDEVVCFRAPSRTLEGCIDQILRGGMFAMCLGRTRTRANGCIAEIARGERRGGSS